MKQCRVCGEWKPLDAFSPNGRKRGGRRNDCKPCHNVQTQGIRAASTELAERKCSTCQEVLPASAFAGRCPRCRECQSDVQRGQKVGTYRKLRRAQNGRCAICGIHESEAPGHTDGRLSLDHCHVTGKARGLLCTTCNCALGLFKDDPALLRAAAEYIINNRKEN